jgi:hypothetical protein
MVAQASACSAGLSRRAAQIPDLPSPWLSTNAPPPAPPISRRPAVFSSITYSRRSDAHPELRAFVIGQGLWSPWYAGSSLEGLDREFSRDRIVDSAGV